MKKELYHDLGTDEIKSISLDILKHIKKVCEEENIQYYLAYGTALGAVRHNGFIPWDDDIDIVMTRDNYEKFERAMELSNSHYRLLYLNNKKYSLPLPKVIDTRTELIQYNQHNPMPIGVFVDVFILEKLPEDKVLRERYLRKIDRLQDLWNFIQYDFQFDSWYKNVIHSLAMLIKPRWISLIIDGMSQKYRNTDSNLCTVLTFNYDRRKEITTFDTYGEGCLMEFEGELFPIPKKYDKYLRNTYGDYMKLPPVEQRVSNHQFHSKWL